MLITDEFCDLLQSLLQVGMVAYIETEHFGGTGGQGAAVYSNGTELMAPSWSNSGTINDALKALGVPGSHSGSVFSNRLY